MLHRRTSYYVASFCQLLRLPSRGICMYERSRQSLPKSENPGFLVSPDIHPSIHPPIHPSIHPLTQRQQRSSKATFLYRIFLGGVQLKLHRIHAHARNERRPSVANLHNPYRNQPPHPFHHTFPRSFPPSLPSEPKAKPRNLTLACCASLSDASVV